MLKVLTECTYGTEAKRDKMIKALPGMGVSLGNRNPAKASLNLAQQLLSLSTSTVVDAIAGAAASGIATICSSSIDLTEACFTSSVFTSGANDTAFSVSSLTGMLVSPGAAGADEGVKEAISICLDFVRSCCLPNKALCIFCRTRRRKS